MSLAPGQSLLHYTLIEQIGAGGMGVVYSATDTKLRRDVAIKVLPDDFAQDQERLARFEREAHVLASLNHPGIASIYGLEESNGVRFLVLELVPGQTLADRIAKGALPVDETLAVARQIAEALEEAHEHGIIHRDLKPANIKLTPEGKVRVLDFGLAKAMAGDASSTDLSQLPTATVGGTRSGVVVGTAPYMSPEQARGKPLDNRTDIFAYGSVVYELLAGKRAFGGETVSDTIAAILEREPDWKRLPEATPIPLQRLLRRCVQKDPHERLQHIGDARFEIEDAVSGAANEAAVHAAAVPLPAWRRHLHAGVTVLLLLTVFALGYGWMQYVPPERRVMRFEIPVPAGSTFNLDPEVPGPAVISPDGLLLVFSARDGAGELRLHVRQMDTTETRVLPGTDGAYYPFWSPNSDFVGFFSHGKLKKVEATGGPPVSLCNAPSARGGSWNSDGVIIFSPGSTAPLHRVSDTGGVSAPITQLDSKRKHTSHRHPRFLPDGRRFLYVAAANVAGAGEEVLAGSLDGNGDKLLLRSEAQADFASGHLLFLQQRTLMARPFDAKLLEFTGGAVPVAEKVTLDADADHAVFSVSTNGVLAYHSARNPNSNLQWFDRDGRSQGLLGEPAEYAEVHLSPTGTHAAVSIAVSGGMELWIFDIARNIRTRFAFGSSSWLPSWSINGSELVFTSARDGRYGLYRKSLAGSGEEKLLIESEDTMFAEGWSPNGELLAFDRHVLETAYDIWILPLNGEREPYPFVQTRFDEAGGAFSPDGHWLAYQSVESGRWEVYATPFPGPGRKWQVSTGGGAWPRWGKNGKEIFYHGINGHLMAVEVATGESAFVVGASEKLFAITRLGHFYEYAVTQDGQRFLVVKPEEEDDSAPLTVVLDWAAELE